MRSESRTKGLTVTRSTVTRREQERRLWSGCKDSGQSYLSGFESFDLHKYELEEQTRELGTLDDVQVRFTPHRV